MTNNERVLPGIDLSWSRLGGVAGILGVALFIVGGAFVQGFQPEANESIDKVRDWYTSNGKQYVAGDFIIGLSIIFGLLPFFVALRERLHHFEGEPGLLSQLVLLSSILFIVFGAVASAFGDVLAITIKELDSAGVIRALQYGWFVGYNIATGVLTLFFLALALVILKARAFWTWLAWTSLVLAVISLLASAAGISRNPTGVLANLSHISHAGFGLTILVCSSQMLRENPRLG